MNGTFPDEPTILSCGLRSYEAGSWDSEDFSWETLSFSVSASIEITDANEDKRRTDVTVGGARGKGSDHRMQASPLL
jgi:hypothetical protein